jgi:hypothetical protein
MTLEEFTDAFNVAINENDPSNAIRKNGFNSESHRIDNLAEYQINRLNYYKELRAELLDELSKEDLCGMVWIKALNLCKLPTEEFIRRLHSVQRAVEFHEVSTFWFNYLRFKWLNGKIENIERGKSEVSLTDRGSLTLEELKQLPYHELTMLASKHYLKFQITPIPDFQELKEGIDNCNKSLVEKRIYYQDELRNFKQNEILLDPNNPVEETMIDDWDFGKKCQIEIEFLDAKIKFLPYQINLRTLELNTPTFDYPDLKSKEQPAQQDNNSNKIEEVSEQKQSLTLKDVFADDSKFDYIMALLVDKGYCQPVTYIWKDLKKGHRGLIASILKYLHFQKYYQEKSGISNEQIIEIALNTFRVVIKIDTVKKADPSDFDLSFIPIASTLQNALNT